MTKKYLAILSAFSFAFVSVAQASTFPYIALITVGDIGSGDPEGQLYKFAHNIGETNNLYSDNLEKVGRLKTEFAPVVQSKRTRNVFQKEILQSYRGISVSGTDTSTLTGKVMTGYQGWFNCEGDGAGLGWTHWARDKRKQFGPNNITVDFWPDVSEYGQEELFDTGFRFEDGSPAKVFSSHTRQTVIRHFEWMRDYEIDGAFIQRFAHGLRSKSMRGHKDTVLSNAREGANRAGRSYAVLYDLSGLPKGGANWVRKVWKRLRKKMEITQDPAYQHHEGKPVVAVWGIGFNDKTKPRKYTLAECRALVEFLKKDGCSVMLGVPTGWQTLDRDSLPDPEFHDLIKLADVVSPWTVGRYKDPAGVARHAEKYWKPNISWCVENGLDYLPVIFPGFSWHNLKGAELGAIPRLKGQFLWSQITAAKRAGSEMIYVAMFDEVDEGTAIFKCTENFPTSDGVRFLDYEGLPSDFYLRLTGEAGKLLRDEIPATDTVPQFGN